MRFSGRRCPPGPIYGSSVPAYGRRPVLSPVRIRFAALGSPGACPSGLVARASSASRMRSALRAWAFTLLLRACLLMRCPGGDALSPRAPLLGPAFQPGHPAWASPPRPALGSADRMTVRGRPVARLRSLPLSQTWAGHRPSVQRAENTSNLVNPDGEKSGSLGRGPIKGPIKGSIGSGNPDRFLIPVRRLPPGFEPVEVS